MPPPSPVWDWNPFQKPPAKVWRDAKLQMAVRIDGIWHPTTPFTLKVTDPNPKAAKKGVVASP